VLNRFSGPVLLHLKNMGPPLASRVRHGDAHVMRHPSHEKNPWRVEIISFRLHIEAATVTCQGFRWHRLAEQENSPPRRCRSLWCRGYGKEGRIEIQGDQREAVARILTTPVFVRCLLAGDGLARIFHDGSSRMVE